MVSWQSRLVDKALRVMTNKSPDANEPIEKMRARYTSMAKRLSKLDIDADFRPVKAGRTKAEWVEPGETQDHRVILYLHGGGYCAGSPETHRSIVARLCDASAARGLVVDYRLAPEHKFPAAVEDALDAYQWLLGQGIDPKGIALAGEGSGGGLAIATCMALRDANAPLPAAVVAMSPWTDLAITSWSALKLQKDDASQSMMVLSMQARHYLQGKSPTEPLASPLFGDFRGLPPHLIHVGANEILRDDASRLSQRAEAGGAEMSVEVWAGMPHAFQFYSMLPEADGSLARLGSFIKTRTVAIPASRRKPIENAKSQV
jgi:epsilon-lactone hydrolase